MKEISDKEFDGFFKSSFEDFEVQPSANGWEKITQKLDQKPAKKKFPVYWAAAASAVIIMGLGIALYQQPGEVIKLRPDQNVASVSDEVPGLNYKNDSVADYVNQSSAGTTGINENVYSHTTAKGSDKKFLASKAVVQKIKTSDDATKATENNVLNIEPANQTQELVSSKPVRTPSVTEKILAEEALKNGKSMEVQPTKVLAAQPVGEQDSEEDGATSNRKLRIKSVGDLVNFVVAKVDKRDEKIIRMSKTDESDNEVTGINLGIFKFKKAEK